MRPFVRPKRRGIAIIYVMLIFVALMGVASLAVDGGRYYLVRTQLQMAADAAARYGVSGMLIGDSQPNKAEALARAEQAAGENLVDGVKFIATTGGNDPNFSIKYWSYDLGNDGLIPLNQAPYAVEVTLKASVPLMFGKIIGFSSITSTATSVAMIQPGIEVENYVPAWWNPWLAGMRGENVWANTGNPHNNPDWAGGASTYRRENDPTYDEKSIWVAPLPVTGIPLVPGTPLTFSSVTGDAKNDPGLELYNPDGNTDWMVENFGGAEFGKSNLTAPINSVIGVFLGDDSPQGRTPPEESQSGVDRNEIVYHPKLRQPFFIGDGKTDDGRTQQFIVPEGATRLFVCNMDGYEWNNNGGSRKTTVIRPPVIVLVSDKQVQPSASQSGNETSEGSEGGGTAGQNGGGISGGSGGDSNGGLGGSDQSDGDHSWGYRDGNNDWYQRWQGNDHTNYHDGHGDYDGHDSGGYGGGHDSGGYGGGHDSGGYGGGHQGGGYGH